MTDTPDLAAIQTTLDALSGGQSADQAAVEVLIAAVSNLTDLLGAALARVAMLEAAENARTAQIAALVLHDAGL